ncbi:Glucanosyltransferase-domain-containing protein [Lipomyces doorenjongii]|uniref:Glucanosyltransferase-domain-containing protein n=1 Tax=Lipomyces doorenjongii TaxID=383834 RepID=UPI0034CF18A3
MKFESVVLSALAAASVALAAVNPIVVKGNAFFDSVTGDRFYIKGVDYQPPDANGETSDPLMDYNVCSRDVPYIKALGMNTVRVYHVDNAADHSACMQLLQDNGIYLLLDVATADQAISRDYPMYSYNYVLLQHNFATIDAFSNYTNVLGFVAANEVVNAVNTTDTATVLKAVIRDMKQYISSRSPRTIPVGYCAADVAENRYQLAHYLNCGDESERAEFFGLNDYSWCGSSSYTVSGYNQKVANFNNYSIPLFFSEYGCNLVEPREFTEVQAIYSSQMIPVFSGGLVYEYIQEANNYGLVEVSSDLKNVTPLGDYYNLQYQFNHTQLPSGDGGYHANNKASECPAYVKGLWEANDTLPSMPAQASQYLTAGAGTPLGTDGPSNQWVPNSVLGSTSSSSAASSTSTVSSTGSASSSSSNSASNSTASAAASRGAAVTNVLRRGAGLNSFVAPVIVVAFSFAIGLVAF